MLGIAQQGIVILHRFPLGAEQGGIGQDAIRPPFHIGVVFADELVERLRVAGVVDGLGRAFRRGGEQQADDQRRHQMWSARP